MKGFHVTVSPVIVVSVSRKKVQISLRSAIQTHASVWQYLRKATTYTILLNDSINIHDDRQIGKVIARAFCVRLRGGNPLAPRLIPSVLLFVPPNASRGAEVVLGPVVLMAQHNRYSLTSL